MTEVECHVCMGSGFTAEHDLPNRHGEDGECVSCPVQVLCELCEGTGLITGGQKEFHPNTTEELPI